MSSRMSLTPNYLKIYHLSRAEFGRGMSAAKFDSQSPAVHWMALTSSLTCLSCRIHNQSLHSLNAFPSFSKKALFTDSASSHPLPQTPFQLSGRIQGLRNPNSDPVEQNLFWKDSGNHFCNRLLWSGGVNSNLVDRLHFSLGYTVEKLVLGVDGHQNQLMCQRRLCPFNWPRWSIYSGPRSFLTFQRLWCLQNQNSFSQEPFFFIPDSATTALELFLEESPFSCIEIYRFRVGVWKCHRSLPPDPGPSLE